MKNLLETTTNLIRKGLLHVFVGDLSYKVLRFLSSIAVARLVDKDQYGVWNYAYNIYSLILLFDGLGIASGVIQYCAKEKDEKRSFLILKFGKRFGGYVNLLISFITLMMALFAPLKFPSARLYLIGISFVPPVRIFYNVTIQYIRARKRAKVYGYLTFSYAAVYLLFILLTIPFMNVWGLVVSEYAVILLSLLISKRLIPRISEEKVSLDNGLKKEIVKFSIVANLSNVMSQFLYLIDTFLVGQILGKADVLASYKVGTLIPYNLNFIPAALITFFYPYFATKSDDKLWVRKKAFQFLKALAVLNSLIVVLFILFGDHITHLLFGNKYSDSAIILKILMIGYFFAATFRIPLGNFIASLGKVKINLINSIVTGFSNIILDILLILNYGVIGAAFATVSVFILSSTINLYAFLRLTKK
ncbi:oligosaccharide flippase family protein [Thermotoga sp. SG1]|uniref:oligosaccharide flippase family protein n=1 Tax=Thermotoga sp. SG1 TaxID=126739 RepID=UPI001E2D1D37|nr:oligosaccharide flippase family protein [Thermotoga sp. SG1]